MSRFAVWHPRGGASHRGRMPDGRRGSERKRTGPRVGIPLTRPASPLHHRMERRRVEGCSVHQDQTRKTMPNYVDGFVVPVPKKKLAAYTRIAKKASKIWKEHGALD